MLSSLKHPLVTIVVPNFNGQEYLAETLRSVRAQDYDNIELIVIDGGSTDGSLDVIQAFAPQLDFWISEPDSGQSDAINKGLARARGEIVNWLCSDDTLLPGAISTVVELFDNSTDVVVGGCRWFYEFEGGKRVDFFTQKSDIVRLPCFNPVNQPSCFYRKSLLRNPPLDHSFRVAMDAELWSYFLRRGARWQTTNEILSIYRMTGMNISSNAGLKAYDEWKRIVLRWGTRRQRAALTAFEGWQRSLTSHRIANCLGAVQRPGLLERLINQTAVLCFGQAARDVGSQFAWIYEQSLRLNAAKA